MYAISSTVAGQRRMLCHAETEEAIVALEGPSRTIVVEPMEAPDPREVPEQEPAPAVAPEREPEKVPA